MFYYKITMLDNNSILLVGIYDKSVILDLEKIKKQLSSDVTITQDNKIVFFRTIDEAIILSEY